jgi:ectoine hydroxylase-related dioxygenase (phytanoyl-CoA dioxygenase family)
VNFQRDGYAIREGVLDGAEIDGLIEALARIGDRHTVRSRGGVYAVRNLLTVCSAAAELARSPKILAIVCADLAANAFPVQGTLFDKTAGANWLVPWHQDLTISVAERVEVPGYGPWSRKAGVWHVQPLAQVLQGMISIRIHLDDCGESNGALRVLPGSHLRGRLPNDEAARLQTSIAPVTCAVSAGGVLSMRPLLLHASSAAAHAGHRRVIHIDYARAVLDGGLRWRADELCAS